MLEHSVQREIMGKDRFFLSLLSDWLSERKMVSRRKILSRSRDNLVESQYEEQDEEDVWYNLDKLYKVIFI